MMSGKCLQLLGSRAGPRALATSSMAGTQPVPELKHTKSLNQSF